MVGINQSESRRARFLFLLSNETRVERRGGEKSKKGFCSKYDIIAN